MNQPPAQPPAPPQPTQEDIERFHRMVGTYEAMVPKIKKFVEEDLRARGIFDQFGTDDFGIWNGIALAYMSLSAELALYLGGNENNQGLHSFLGFARNAFETAIKTSEAQGAASREEDAVAEAEAALARAKAAAEEARAKNKQAQEEKMKKAQETAEAIAPKKAAPKKNKAAQAPAPSPAPQPTQPVPPQTPQVAPIPAPTPAQPAEPAAAAGTVSDD